jgi:leader peptidase (prepilin peptidase)/N-methyltransferase
MIMDTGIYRILCFGAFSLGACIASFLNVVIWRVPRGESIVNPPSHCPKCGASIRWWQNIPVLSWICLRGRCAGCRAPISPRYVLVEILGGALFLAVFTTFGLTPATPVYWLWISLMIAGSFIDFDHKLLPDFVTVGGMVLGVAYATLLYFLSPQAGREFLSFSNPIVYSLSGLAFGFGLLWLVRYFGSKAFGREAMGLGDVFLMGAVGALFGPVAVLVSLVLSSLFGSIVGIGMILLSKARFGKFVEIPSGPYICAGCFAWMFHGREIVLWYLNLFKV